RGRPRQVDRGSLDAVDADDRNLLLVDDRDGRPAGAAQAGESQVLGRGGGQGRVAGRGLDLGRRGFRDGFGGRLDRRLLRLAAGGQQGGKTNRQAGGALHRPT